MAKNIILVNEFGGFDGLSMVYDLDWYDNLAGVRPAVVEPKEELIPLPFDNIALSPQLPFLAELIEGGECAVLYNYGPMRDKNNSVLPLHLGSHSNQSEQISGVGAEDSADMSGYLGRFIEKLYSRDNTYLYPALAISGTSTALKTKYRLPQNYGLTLNKYNFNRRKYPGREEVGHNRMHEITGASANFKYDLFEKRQTSLISGIEEINEVSVDPVNLPEEMNNNMKAVIKAIENRELYEHYKGVVISTSVNAPGSWDMHQSTLSGMNSKRPVVDKQLELLVGELKARGYWGDTVIIMCTEFGRTTRNNSANGTDHGWGNFSFVMGGAVEGRRIVGDKLDWQGVVANGTGRIHPTLSTDQIFASIMRWAGLTMEETLECVVYPEGSFEKTANIFGVEEPMTGEVVEPEPSDLGFTVEVEGYGEFRGPGNHELYSNETLTAEIILDVPEDIELVEVGGYEHEPVNGTLTIELWDQQYTDIRVKGKGGLYSPFTSFIVWEEEEPPYIPDLGYRVLMEGIEITEEEVEHYEPVTVTVEFNKFEDVRELNFNGYIYPVAGSTLDVELIFGENIFIPIGHDGGEGEVRVISLLEIQPPVEPEFNITPEAVITGPAFGFTGDHLVFEGRSSSDPDGEITEYIWSLDGVEAGRDKSIALTLQEARDYILALKVIDDMGGYNIRVKVITIIPPASDTLAVIKAPVSGKAGEEIVFDGSMSETSDGEIADYIWEAEGIKRSGNSVEEFTFNEAGAHQVKLTVADFLGNENTSTFNIEILGGEVPDLSYRILRDGIEITESEIEHHEPVTLTVEFNKFEDVRELGFNGGIYPVAGSPLDVELMSGENTFIPVGHDGMVGEMRSITFREAEPPVAPELDLEYYLYNSNWDVLVDGMITDTGDATVHFFTPEDVKGIHFNGNLIELPAGSREIALELLEGENSIEPRGIDDSLGRITRVTYIQEEVPERPEDTERVATKAVAAWRGEPETNMLDKVNVYIWGTTGVNSNRVSYLEFDLADIRNADYDEIKLALFIKGKAGVELNFYGSETYTEWEEDTLTWNNSKYHEADLSRIVIEDDVVHIMDYEFEEDMPSHGYVEFDVTEYVRGVSGDKATFIITNNRLDGNQGVHFKPVRNTGQEPKLRFKTY